MSKIEIKDLYLIFGNEKQKALKMLKDPRCLKKNCCKSGVKNWQWYFKTLVCYPTVLYYII